MKKQWFTLACCSLMLIGLTSCQEEVEKVIPSNRLYGYWENSAKLGEYMRFMNEQEDQKDGDYLYGYEWDTNEDVKETDVWKEYHGNGWFKYKMTAYKNDTIWYQRVMMSNGGAEYENRYLIETLTQTKFVYSKDKVQYSYIKTNQPK